MFSGRVSLTLQTLFCIYLGVLLVGFMYKQGWLGWNGDGGFRID